MYDIVTSVISLIMLLLVVLYMMRRDSGVVTFFFFQAEDGIRDLVRSRGLGDVYKRQQHDLVAQSVEQRPFKPWVLGSSPSQITQSPYII